MKDKRIWIVIICILVIGTGVTHYTKYYVKSQATAMDTATTAGGMPAGAPSTASASEVKEEEQKEQEATEIPAPMGRSLGAAPQERARGLRMRLLPWKTGQKPPLLLKRQLHLPRTGPRQSRYIQRMKCLWSRCPSRR